MLTGINLKAIILIATAVVLPVCAQGTKGKASGKASGSPITNKASIIVRPFKMGVKDFGKLGYRIQTDGLTEKLKSALSATRKFDLLERQDVDMAADEVAFSKSSLGNKKLKTGGMASADYIVSGEISVVSAGINSTPIAFTDRYLAVTSGTIIADVKVFETRTGKVARAVKVEASNTIKNPVNRAVSGSVGEIFMEDLQRLLVENMALKVVEIVFPMKVVSMENNLAYVNRGEGGGLQPGDTLIVYEAGKAMIDPDTGESLGTTETAVATLRVVEILPKFSKAEVLKGESKVFAGQIVRLAQRQDEHR
ncbi:MAG: hypothetical protein IPP78_15410 [Holophagaceae bacterium]|nr:hypothetical protein [Holophagaceae bacterium]